MTVTPLNPDTAWGAYRPLRGDDLARHLAGLPEIAARLGGRADHWTLREVSDGNLNIVHIVTGPAGQVCTKQALPWVRQAEWWKLPLDRAFFEASYMRTLGGLTDGRLPALYHYDAEQYLIVMEALTAHAVLRGELIAGARPDGVGATVGAYVARAAVETSAAALPFERRHELAALFGRNHALIRISVDLVFTDPYHEHTRNRWTPPLDPLAAALKSDLALKRAIQRLLGVFLETPQALVHGDLHTGSVMVGGGDTRIIDPEFAFFGPVAFDLGAFLANLVMAWFAQPHQGGDREANQRYLVAEARALVDTFADRFLARSNAHPGGGDRLPAALFEGEAGATARGGEFRRILDGILADVPGFAAAKILRRIFGFAHVADFEGIADPLQRAAAEAGAAALARDILVQPERFRTVGEVLEALPRYRRAPAAAQTFEAGS
jgi:5-methylthioribose kinase